MQESKRLLLKKGTIQYDHRHHPTGYAMFSRFFVPTLSDRVQK